MELAQRLTGAPQQPRANAWRDPFWEACERLSAALQPYDVVFFPDGTLRPDTLTAVTVNVDDKDTRDLQADWEQRELPVPLTVIDSPYREITRPILQYVRDIRRQSPRDVVMVYIPEYVVGHWWEHILHNQSALRLKGRLLFTPGVMVTSVPYQLISSQAAEERQDREERVAGQVRRGARKASGDR